MRDSLWRAGSFCLLETCSVEPLFPLTMATFGHLLCFVFLIWGTPHTNGLILQVEPTRYDDRFMQTAFTISYKIVPPLWLHQFVKSWHLGQLVFALFTFQRSLLWTVFQIFQDYRKLLCSLHAFSVHFLAQDSSFKNRCCFSEQFKFTPELIRRYRELP